MQGIKLRREAGAALNQQSVTFEHPHLSLIPSGGLLKIRIHRLLYLKIFYKCRLKPPNMAAAVLQRSPAEADRMRDRRKVAWTTKRKMASMLKPFGETFRQLLLSWSPSRVVRLQMASAVFALSGPPRLLQMLGEGQAGPCRGEREVGLTGAFCLSNTLTGTPRLCLAAGAGAGAGGDHRQSVESTAAV